MYENITVLWYSPLQLLPSLSITYPRLHSHLCDPWRFTHCWAQPPLLVRHSFTSEKKWVYPRNYSASTEVGICNSLSARRHRLTSLLSYCFEFIYNEIIHLFHHTCIEINASKHEVSSNYQETQECIIIILTITAWTITINHVSEIALTPVWPLEVYTLLSTPTTVSQAFVYIWREMCFLVTSALSTKSIYTETTPPYKLHKYWDSALKHEVSNNYQETQECIIMILTITAWTITINHVSEIALTPVWPLEVYTLLSTPTIVSQAFVYICRGGEIISLSPQKVTTTHSRPLLRWEKIAVYT